MHPHNFVTGFAQKCQFPRKAEVLVALFRIPSGTLLRIATDYACPQRSLGGKTQYCQAAAGARSQKPYNRRPDKLSAPQEHTQPEPYPNRIQSVVQFSAVQSQPGADVPQSPPAA